MFGEKKGLSMIVTTLLIILLVIVAVGIVWVMARGLFQRGGEQFNLGAECLNVQIKATRATCDATTPGAETCSVTVEREAGGNDIGGIKLVFSDGDNSYTHDVAGNIAELETKTESAIDLSATVQTSVTVANIESVDVAVYFLDESGNEQLCSGASTFEDVVVTTA